MEPGLYRGPASDTWLYLVAEDGSVYAANTAGADAKFKKPNAAQLKAIEAQIADGTVKMKPMQEAVQAAPEAKPSLDESIDKAVENAYDGSMSMTATGETIDDTIKGLGKDEDTEEKPKRKGADGILDKAGDLVAGKLDEFGKFMGESPRNAIVEGDAKHSKAEKVDVRGAKPPMEDEEASEGPIASNTSVK